jgi:hypothetical protein
MADAETTSRVDDAWSSFKRRAATNGRCFDQEIEPLLSSGRKFTPQERVAVSAFLRSQQPELQPSLRLNEIREGLV